ncbi:hypothetical protein F5X68DRAFT_60511 [Plectosphaerella plurivora]|uniref:F-box domain-containing protein n=1 Tax=Plectosphaerella plurivora TaxID=936078 RepID=A0A9P9AF97_9PEZI|nr:hypothetical protein F5X68DRAFT_60511 [Plectosphaerella plurivora]
MTSILSCPPEILLHFFSQFDSFADVTALAATCKRLNYLWQTAAPTIIWAIAPKCIPVFDEALMAVRATNIVKPAFESGHIPPDVGPLENLSGASTRPSLSELVQVTDLQHLVRCLQYMYFHSSESDNGNSPWTGLATIYPGDTHRVGFWFQGDTKKRDLAVEKWGENYSRATYRLFLAAAVLARAYHERFFLKSDHRTSHTSAVYEYRVDAKNDAATFGPLCTWILKTSRAEAVRRKFVPLRRQRKARWAGTHPGPAKEDEDDTSDSDEYDAYNEDEDSDDETTPNEDIYAMRELVAMMVAYELTSIRFLELHRWESKYLQYPTPLAEETTGKTRKVSVVMFGSFRLEEVTMPADIQDTKNTLLPSRRIIPTERPVQDNDPTSDMPSSSRYPYSWSIPWRLREVGENPETDSSGWPGPELALKLLSYIHKVTWNQMISPGDPHWASSIYRTFIADGSVFFRYKTLVEYGLGYLETCK